MVSAADILAAKILVVDDKETNIRLLQGMLRIAGYTDVDSTTDPRAVCELYREKRYSLILLDLQMPGMDGFQVMEELKTIEGDGYLPVLVITAQPAHKLRALEAGAKDFVSKPFDLAELRARVHNILEVRLLHLATRKYSRALEETVQQLEDSREVIRLKTLEDDIRREQEFVLAQETQESLLPRSIPHFENFHVEAFSTPTRYVGGDFYDFLPLDRGQWTGILADVSGKGMSAALLSSMVLGAFTMECRAGTAMPDILHRINQLVFEKSLGFQFVTIFLFRLGADGSGEFISAGHNPAYVFRAATGKIEKLFSEHALVGMFEGVSYESRPLTLGQGDVLVVNSDGVTDAQNNNNEMFGEARLLNIVRQQAGAGSVAIKKALMQAIEEFTGGRAQTDDITLVVVERYQ